MDKRDYPNMGKTEANNNHIKGGSILFTRGFLRRMCGKTGLITAMVVGLSYVINAADGMINGENFDGSSGGNNNKNRSNNGNRRN